MGLPEGVFVVVMECCVLLTYFHFLTFALKYSSVSFQGWVHKCKEVAASLRAIVSVVVVEDNPKITKEKIHELPLISLYVVGRKGLIFYDGPKYAKKKATKMSRK